MMLVVFPFWVIHNGIYKQIPKNIFKYFSLELKNLVKKCGKKIVRSETESTVLRVIDRRHMSTPVDVSNLDIGATVSDLKRGRMDQYALVALENKFTNKIRLGHPGRILIKQGPLILKRSFNETKYEFFLFNDLLLYASYVNYRFKFKKSFLIDREFEIVDLQDESKRKNQFWMIVADCSLLVQTGTAYEKQMWLDDLARWFPKARREGKKQKHEELLERQKEQELQSLRLREERKQIDPSSFSSATEVPKDYVPEEQMKITRGQSGRKNVIQQQGSSLIDLQLPGQPNHSSSSSSSFTSSSLLSSSLSSSSSEMCSSSSSIALPTISSSRHGTLEHSRTSPSHHNKSSNSTTDFPTPSKNNDSSFTFSGSSSFSASPSKQEHDLYTDRIGNSSLAPESGYLHFVIKAD